MKNDSRNDPNHNLLAELLIGWYKKLEPVAPGILTIAVIGIIAAIVVGYVRSRSQSVQSDATLMLLLSAGEADTASLENIRTDFDGTAAARLADLARADLLLSRGVERMFTDWNMGKAEIDNGIKVYQDVLKEANDTAVRSRANLGLARSYEALGDFEQAQTAYQDVIDVNESDGMVRYVRQRLTQLQRPEAQKFADWFAARAPLKMDPSAPPGSPDGDILPDGPDISFPDVKLPGDEASDLDLESGLGLDLDVPMDKPDPLGTTISPADANTSDTQPAATSE